MNVNIVNKLINLTSLCKQKTADEFDNVITLFGWMWVVERCRIVLFSFLEIKHSYGVNMLKFDWSFSETLSMIDLILNTSMSVYWHQLLCLKSSKDTRNTMTSIVLMIINMRLYWSRMDCTVLVCVTVMSSIAGAHIFAAFFLWIFNF